MKANYSSTSSGVEMPLRWPLFLLAVFASANPFDPARAGGGLPDLDATVQLIEKGSAIREFALLLLGLFALVTFVNRKYRRLRVNGLLGLLTLCFIVLAFVSPVWAEDPSLTLRRVAVLGLMVFGGLATAARFSYIQTAALGAYACGLTLVISLFVEIYSGTFHPFDGSWRFSGMLYSVSQGWNCGLLFISALVLARVLPRSRTLLVLLALTALLFLFLTRSRLPLLTAILAAAVFGSFGSPQIRKLTFVLGYVLLVCTCLFGFVLFVPGGNLSGSAKTIAALGRGEEAASTLGTFTGRKELWDAEFVYARARPILGYGYNSFLTPTNLASISNTVGWVPASPHSGYIGAVLGLGYLGGSILVLALLLAMRRSLGLARRNPGAAFAAAIMIWMCCNLFLEDSIITEPTFPTFFCLTILLSLAFKDGSHARRFDLPPNA